MSEYAGRGDPARTMDLLWGTASLQGKPGPRQRLRVDEVVTAAIGIADAGGLEALSMRSVAGAVGVTAMALYTYVPSKAELVELMVDRVIGEQPLPEVGRGWRESLETYARDALAGYRRHPWLLGVAVSRTVFGPNVIERFDAALGAVADAGLAAADRVRAISLVDNFTRGAALALVEAEHAVECTGQSDDDWWHAREPLLSQRLQQASFPNIEHVAAQGAFNQIDQTVPYTQQRATADFDFGLQRVLDGIAALATP